jgi:hypothetical protein
MSDASTRSRVVENGARRIRKAPLASMTYHVATDRDFQPTYRRESLASCLGLRKILLNEAIAQIVGAQPTIRTWQLVVSDIISHWKFTQDAR